MKTLPIKSTKDYSQFKSILGNRAVFSSHVNRLANAIRQKNLLPYQPIMVNEKMFVIDGQHRLAAAKRLKIEIPYIVVPDTDLEDVRLLNSNLKSWSALDFAESYAKTGNKHYKQLLTFMKKYDLHLSMASALLRHSNDPGGGANASSLIKSGTFEVKDADWAEQVIQMLQDFRPFTDMDVWKHRHFVKALLSLYEKGASPAELLAKMKEHGKRVRKQADFREYFFVLSDIYDFKRRKGHIAVI